MLILYVKLIFLD